MNDLEIIENVLNKYSREKEKSLISSKCEHINTVEDNNIILCSDCGEELKQKISLEKEWRYYSGADNRHSSDPNRCQIRKIDDKNIFKDVDSFNFSESIINKANDIYLQVTKKKKKSPTDADEYKIFRGNHRRAIIFGCVFNAYKLSDKPQTCDSLIKIFGIDKKIGLKGLKHVNMNAPKRSPVRTTYITPVHLLEDILNKFDANTEKKKQVIDLYDKIKNKSERIKRSRPQSVAASLVYYWICLKEIDINIKKYSEIVELSVLTINKLAKEIELILQTPGIVR
jgi:transcription initiation factor TFIIIB Brf1 subunit/transcription initiation factor TFIIB